MVDAATSPTVERIFGLVESGATFGDVARALNAEGVVGRRGKPFNSRTVRTIVTNADYAVQNGYPPLIESGRCQAIQDGLRRLDPSAVQRRGRSWGEFADSPVSSETPQSVVGAAIAVCQQLGFRHALERCQALPATLLVVPPGLPLIGGARPPPSASGAAVVNASLRSRNTRRYDRVALDIDRGASLGLVPGTDD